MIDCHSLNDHTSEGHATNVSLFNTQLIEQRNPVHRHVIQSVRYLNCSVSHEFHREFFEIRNTMIIKVGGQSHIAIIIAYDEVTSVGELLAKVFIPGNHLAAQAHDQQQWFSLGFTESVKFYCKAIGIYFRHWS